MAFVPKLVSLNEGPSIVIDRPTVRVGRSRSRSDFCIRDPHVSNVHCQIVTRPEGIYLIDCSRHGTLVNGQQIRELQLRHGDIISIVGFAYRAEFVAPLADGQTGDAFDPDSEPTYPDSELAGSRYVRRVAAQRPQRPQQTSQPAVPPKPNLPDDKALWLLQIRNMTLGPMSWPDLLSIIEQEAVRPNDRVRRIDETAWKPVVALTGRIEPASNEIPVPVATTASRTPAAAPAASADDDGDDFSRASTFDFDFSFSEFDSSSNSADQPKAAPETPTIEFDSYHGEESADSAPTNEDQAEQHQRWCEQLIHDFEHEWRTGRPRLLEFLANRKIDLASPLTGPVRRAIIRLIECDLQNRWKSGRPFEYAAQHAVFDNSLIPDYLDKIPFLRRQSKHVVALWKLEQSLQTSVPTVETVELHRPVRRGGSSTAVVDQPANKVPAPVIGQRLSTYELVEVIGRGGMSHVYKARHTRLDRVVAVKVLTESVMQSKEAMERFRREMRAVGQLRHPNIVPALDADEDQGIHFLVLEFVNGIDLASLLELHGTLSIADACEIARQTALGLEHAHQQQLVHRDLKPSNLILNLEGTVQILDFGLARWSEDLGGPEKSDLTPASALLGTCDYVAPEQIKNAREADGRCDLYGLGCTLFHALAGEPPFRLIGKGKWLKTLLAHSTAAIPSLRDRRPDVPPQLDAIMSQLLAKQPDDRFATAASLVEALNPWCATADLKSLAAVSSERITVQRQNARPDTDHSTSDSTH